VRSLAGLAISITTCLIAAVPGSMVTAPAITTWYNGLRKPSLAPPNWVFAPAWTTLYLLMGVSLYLILNAELEKNETRRSIAVFSIQLLLNISWSYLFFGLRSILLGLIGITLLWIAIVLTIISSSKVSRPAALLLIPYLAWVSFASYLNYMLLILNT
jgi:tryptophan-rich sensory protein